VLVLELPADITLLVLLLLLPVLAAMPLTVLKLLHNFLPMQVLAQLGTEGVLVLEVPAGTPAAAAGLRATYRDVFGDIVLGDILVGMDTRPIRSTADLVAALDERRPGDKVRQCFGSSLCLCSLPAVCCLCRHGHAAHLQHCRPCGST
jgi:hypothetical protein